MVIQKKQKVNDFSLKDQFNHEVRLSDFKGKKVLLSFHPLAWTPICSQQMKSLEDNKNRLTGLNTVALGISIDSVPCKKAWGESLGIKNTPLLADFWPHGQLAKKLKLFRDRDGFSERANILIDEQGNILFKKIYEIKLLPDLEEIINFLKNQR